MWEGVEMSRPVINGLTNLSLDSSCIAMETINIPDPSRLRVPFPGRVQRNGSSNPMNTNNVCPPTSQLEDFKEELILDIPPVIKQPRLEARKKESVLQFEMQSWTFSLVYAIFASALALCNLFALQSSGRMCSACCTLLSPLPVIALILQAATTPMPIGLALLLCALLLPSVCVLWILPFATAYIVVLALAMLAYAQQRGVVAYVSCAGAVLGLGQTILVQDPQWGVSISLFFLAVLCVTSSERITVKFTAKAHAYQNISSNVVVEAQAVTSCAEWQYSSTLTTCTNCVLGKYRPSNLPYYSPYSFQFLTSQSLSTQISVLSCTFYAVRNRQPVFSCSSGFYFWFFSNTWYGSTNVNDINSWIICPSTTRCIQFANTYNNGETYPVTYLLSNKIATSTWCKTCTTLNAAESTLCVPTCTANTYYRPLELPLYTPYSFTVAFGTSFTPKPVCSYWRQINLQPGFVCYSDTYTTADLAFHWCVNRWLVLGFYQQYLQFNEKAGADCASWASDRGSTTNTYIAGEVDAVKFLMQAVNSNSQQWCAPNPPTCSPGSYRGPCTQLAPGSCIACAACPTGKYSTCGGTSAGSCNICSACAAGFYSTCGGLMQGECLACTTCGDGYYSTCSAYSAGICQPCPQCLNGYYSIMCGGFSAGSCTQCTN